MIKTIYICDNCNAEQDTSNQMWPIVLFVGEQNSRTLCNPTIKQLWCRACLAKHSLTDFVKKEEHPEKIDPPPTFAENIEYLLRDLIREEME